MKNNHLDKQTNIVVPPSYLGFVCKPDLPPYLNILFKAKKPLPVLIKEHKGKAKRYGGIFENESHLKTVLSSHSKVDIDKGNRYLQIAIENKKNQEELKEKIKQWNPKNDPKITGVSENTIFVGRLKYTVDEKILEKNFRPCGKIVRLKLLRDLNGKSRGYAFIEFSDRQSAKEAFDTMHHKLIEGREIIVDFEKDREKKSFLPLKLGGKHGKYREYCSLMKQELAYIHEIKPELKPENLSDFRSDLIRRQDKESRAKEKSHDIEKKGEDKYAKSSKIEKKGNSDDLPLNELHVYSAEHTHRIASECNNNYLNEEDNKNLSKKRANDSKHFKNFKEYLHKASDNNTSNRANNKIKSENELEAGEINFK